MTALGTPWREGGFVLFSGVQHRADTQEVHCLRRSFLELCQFLGGQQEASK